MTEAFGTKIVLLNEWHSVNQNQGENANSDHVSSEFVMAINKKVWKWSMSS